MNENYSYILIDEQGRIIEYYDDSEELNAILFAKGILSEQAIDSQILSITEDTYDDIDQAFKHPNPNAIKGYRFARELTNVLEHNML